MALTRLVPRPYRAVLSSPRARSLLATIAVSDLGDGMSVVTLAWAGIQLAPDHAALLIGAALAAYDLPGGVGVFVLHRFLHHRPAHVLVILDSAARAAMLGLLGLLGVAQLLTPTLFLGLLAASSLFGAWGLAGRYTLLSEVVGPEQRLTANAVLTATGSAAVIAGPALAGILVALSGPYWLIALDAASFAFLGVQAWRLRPPPDVEVPGPESVDTARATAGFRLLTRYRLVGLLVMIWVFFFLYGPVEVALPLYVTDTLHAGAGILGTYWALFGVGALVGSFLTTALEGRAPWPTMLAIAAGWGLCLVPFGFDVPVAVTMAGLAVGGLVYGPFAPFTYALFQSRTPLAQMSLVLATRNAVLLTPTPLGAALGGPLTTALGPSATLALSGVATVLLAAIAGLCVRRTSTLRP